MKQYPPALAIQLEFNPESVIRVLRWGAQPETSPHSHKDIAEWCDRFWCKHLDDDPLEEIARLLPILSDVDAQWELYLVNTFTLDELQRRTFNEVQLPAEWFREWLRQAEAQPCIQPDEPASGGSAG